MVSEHVLVAASPPCSGRGRRAPPTTSADVWLGASATPPGKYGESSLVALDAVVKQSISRRIAGSPPAHSYRRRGGLVGLGHHGKCRQRRARDTAIGAAAGSRGASPPTSSRDVSAVVIPSLTASGGSFSGGPVMATMAVISGKIVIQVSSAIL